MEKNDRKPTLDECVEFMEKYTALLIFAGVRPKLQATLDYLKEYQEHLLHRHASELKDWVD